MSQDLFGALLEHLQRVKERDAGAMAALRHSLSFAPGHYIKAFPTVEPFCHDSSPHGRAAVVRQALYLGAGLFATHPKNHERSLAQAFGDLRRRLDRPSLELRFLALLGADAEALPDHLRPIVKLLASDGEGYAHAALMRDLSTLLDPDAPPSKSDVIRQRWARDYYRESAPADPVAQDAPAAAAEPDAPAASTS
jgi:CRISPR system Cascade subunit CasB